ncbi:6-phosphogluconate dehydrogenase [Alteracholeplasma palmae J233]|uniref:6-phosphogluconate dehydrogenase n=1 Tax=Alteracholeplasma palmae (strain ATCC 49389 / J233) TaxID=1318466 RepID=U4KKB3_ALTPJ|nr:decarboxylating 6-phosphogluconate dehydrogenase [Alteracholeplasma palmae]CCV64144.1 6-phosphogluconate dehydrogenase [Alteracholeplasma palmae J233]
MKIHLIGLGKMGSNLALNLKDHGHEVIGYDPSEQVRKTISETGIVVKNSIDELLKNTNKDRTIVWLLVPNQYVDDVINQVKPYLKPNDIIVDGGNSNFNLSLKRYESLLLEQIDFVDVGTSGGTFGARNGACLMIGGTKENFEYLEKVYKDISVPNGYGYMGSPASGHFTKMVHNGIEYGMMQAIGEGFDLLENSNFKNLDYKKIAQVWNNGSIIESALIGYIESAFDKDSHLDEIEGRIDDSGEGMWMIEEALKAKVSLPVITQSLFSRYKSKDEDKFGEKVVAAMRKEFGGHAVYKKK